MRKIAVITGTRAEYGLLYWLLKELEQDPDINFELIVTGMHLSPEFGFTVDQIVTDGFKISERVEMLLSSDTTVGISKSIGLGIISFAEVFDRSKPDLVVVLGDRFEIFAAVSAALVARIPVAHCHGGEASEGVIDEAIRHSITKMSHLHFTATEAYRKRVIQLGEQPDRVFNVGALGIANIRKLALMDKDAFENSIGFALGKQSAVITFHPVTLEKKTAGHQFEELLAVLLEWPELHVIFTKPNSDTDGRIISKMIDEFVQQYPERACAFHSLGQLRYLSALEHVNVVIGNSSSGIIEAPSFGVPTINIGDRQAGRIMAESVIQSDPERNDITRSLKKAFDPAFIETCKTVVNPYDQGNAHEKIIPVLKKFPLTDILKKPFFDLP